MHGDHHHASRRPRTKRAPKSVPIKVVVTAPSKVVPTGVVTVVVTKIQNGRVKYTSTLPYAGGKLTFMTQSLRRGTYAVTATFASATTSDRASTASSGSTRPSFVIKKRRN